MRCIVMSVAALALVAGTAHAQGHGQGRGNDANRGNSASATQAGGSGQGRGQGQAANPGRGADGSSMADSMRGAGNPGQRGNAAQGNSGNRDGQGNRAQAARSAEKGVPDNRGRGNSANAGRGDDAARRGAPAPAAANRGASQRDIGRDIVRIRNPRELASFSPRGPIEGCPPGLAKKNPPCIPPGLVRNGSTWRSAFDRPDWWGLSRLGSGRYAYDDGYLLRFSPDGRIGSFIPLLGGALARGNPWPSFYEPVALPDYYVDFYGLGPVDSYRFADNVVYRVDPQTEAITSIAALLTGDDFTIGRPMPAGYDVYNVPWSYRDQYFDRPDARYRYSDGYIYQVDPQSQLIAAAIELIAS